jgi:serine/threonine-protein kinase RsbW
MPAKPVSEVQELMNHPQLGRWSLRLSSTLASAAEVEAAALKLAFAAGLDEDERWGVALAAREAAVNAVVHGNRLDPARQIAAGFELTGGRLRITLADEGAGFNPHLFPNLRYDPLAAENLLRGSGRGILLMRSFMDEVNFRQLRPGTGLTLIKCLGPAEENRKPFHQRLRRPVEASFLPLGQRGSDCKTGRAEAEAQLVTARLP